MYDIQFDQNDLDANQQGRLSTAQRERLATDVIIAQHKNRIQAVKLFIVGSVFFIIILGAAYSSAGTLDAFLMSPEILPLIVMGVLIGVIITGVICFQAWNLKRFANGTIRVVEGLAFIRAYNTDIIMSRNYRPVYTVEIRQGFLSKVIFHFSEEISLQHFRDNKLYRIYYLPYTQPQILSVEDLGWGG